MHGLPADFQVVQVGTHDHLRIGRDKFANSIIPKKVLKLRVEIYDYLRYYYRGYVIFFISLRNGFGRNSFLDNFTNCSINPGIVDYQELY